MQRFLKSMRRVVAGLFTALCLAATSHGQFPSDYLFGDDITGTDFSISGWFLAPSAQLTDAAFISNKNWDSGSNVGFVLTADARGGGTGHQFKVNANGVGGIRADTDWTDYNLNQWVFVTATFDRDGDLTAYINGGTSVGGNTSIRPTPLGLIDTNASPNFYDFNIGQDGTGNYSSGQGFIGNVDDVAVWRRALDATEVGQLYTRAVNNSQSLGNLIGTSLNGGANNIDLGLVGYYGFENNLNDAAGTAQNGIARLSGGAPGSVSYVAGRFGQAANLTGGNYITIGDAIPPADATFTGNSPANNSASNAANWDLNPASLTSTQGIIVANGTTATFSGANTGPAIFDGTFPVSQLKNMTFGGTGATTFVNFQNSGANGANLIGVGADSRIGVPGSNVTLNMAGAGRIEHRGAGEEAEELQVGQPGSTVSITMDGTTEIAAGTKVADPQFATGFRRPITGDPVPRAGDDLKLGAGSGANATSVNITMNGSSTIYAADVLHPLDSNNGSLTVVQNDNSRVLANWDTRWLTAGGHDANDVVNWTLNDSSAFRVARDHGLGEAGGTGTINLTINDSAQFTAGDRIVLGADGGNVNVVMNGGLMKVGGDSPTQEILVDETGELPFPDVPRAVDWILHLGGGANANLQVKGGRVEVGRSAYVGRGGGTASMTIAGGVVDIKGVAPIGLGLGNGPGGGVPTGINWGDGGGDLIVGADQGDNGVVEFRRGTLDVARDMIVSFDADASGVGGTGRFRNVTTIAGQSISVGNDLSFGGDFIAPSGGVAALEVVFSGKNLTPMQVDGDLYIFNSGQTSSTFSLSVAQGGLVPTVGQRVLIDYTGTRFGQTFAEAPATGITYNLVYDDANSRVLLNITAVSLIDGDFNNDGLYACADVDGLVAQIAAGTNPTSFDLTGDGLVNTADLTAWLSQAGANNLASGNPYLRGDANLDGVVDGTDFGLWNANKFTNNLDWCKGNFNADSVTDGSDFGIWNANKFTSSDSVSLVPEPVGWGIMLLVLIGGSALRRS